jgi:hypothetical protein
LNYRDQKNNLKDFWTNARINAQIIYTTLRNNVH